MCSFLEEEPSREYSMQKPEGSSMPDVFEK